MEIETTVMSAKARILELKSSADFPSEEFNHSIKTWVNMASLLVKQGNMAESTQDDENAYISYVRSCIITTKIIPRHAQYPSMMNDIVCIDLRQKILGTISRMVLLERRLLKRFEQENQQQRLTGARSSISTASSPTLTVAGSPTSCSSSSTLSLNCVSESKMGRALDSEHDVELDASINMLSFNQGSEDDEDEDVAYEEEIAEDFIEMKYEFPAGDDLVPELDPQVYVNHLRHTLTDSVESRSVSPSKPRVQGAVPTLKKKSSNDDERPSLLLSPECQPNFSATMPSALFARQREGGHVRRCSSNEAIRTNVYFPSIMALATAATNGASPSSRFSVCEPTVPRRSDKRSSMIIIGESDVVSFSTKDRVHDYRGVASTIDEGEEDRAQYARDILRSRLTSRRTMSFESNCFHADNDSSPFETLPKTVAPQLRKSNSISRFGGYNRTPRDVPPTPRLSVQNIRLDGIASTTSLTSVPSGSTVANAYEPFESTSNTFPRSHQQQESQYKILHRQSSSVSCSTTSTAGTSSSATTVSSASSPTLISKATLATVTTGKKVGLLRKIRSKPTVKDQLFDIVPTQASPTSHLLLTQQQQQQQQQMLMALVTGHARQQSGPASLPKIAA
ncbi:hypothetical protein BGZ80_002699 [Entomortierella chlamydospora]|uniref:USP8 dimerisation domain-containing protein n=1 Tax=Entomortierella chlamydospora TaxID=101097 RepID=A0A9P6SXF8_9FUNG|nr:hypothetical protein BGZ79_009923 [Entomortierella chlamydospora]KAG0009137.1 hypothetical protein BGZ80_002699 [Entomortierella chlamydospora]